VTIQYSAHSLPQSTPTYPTLCLDSRRPFEHCQHHLPIPPTISPNPYTGSEYENLTTAKLHEAPDTDADAVADADRD
jgi:hypothetical protein